MHAETLGRRSGMVSFTHLNILFSPVVRWYQLTLESLQAKSRPTDRSHSATDIGEELPQYSCKRQLCIYLLNSGLRSLSGQRTIRC